MGGLNALIGQQRPAWMLANALRNRRLPHALLFTGETGVGKETAALEIAAILNCTESGIKRQREGEKTAASEQIRACGSCRTCKRIQSGAHPDVLKIGSEGGYIRIDRIRRITSSLAVKPDPGVTRIVVIDDAHLMNQEASNALLKILEEPPESTVFVLIAPDAGDLLPTIVSRCRHIRFNPIPHKEISDCLISQKGLEPQHAMIVASLARGSLGRALEMADSDWAECRDIIIDLLEKLPGMPASFRHCFAGLLAANRGRLDGILEIIKNWYRDLAVFSSSPEKIYNRDLRHRIKDAADASSAEAIIEKADAVVNAEKAIFANANIRLALDAMFAKLAKKDNYE